MSRKKYKKQGKPSLPVLFLVSTLKVPYSFDSSMEVPTRYFRSLIHAVLQ